MKSFAAFPLLALAASSGVALAQQAGLDPAFGHDGIATIQVEPNDTLPGVDRGASSAVLLRAGLSYYQVGTNTAGIVVTRQHARGGADVEWGRDGTVELVSAGWQLSVSAAASQDHGRLLIAGAATSHDGRTLPLLCRFLRYGAPDPSMHGAAGDPPGCTVGLPSTKANGSEHDERALALAIQPDDRILVATHADSPEGGALHVNRLQASGAPDASFGLADDPLFNRSYTSLGATSHLRFDVPMPIAGMATDAVGRLLLAGSARRVDADGSSSADVFVAAFDDSGRLAADFGDPDMPGLAVVDLANDDAEPSEDVAIAFERSGDGRLLIAGTAASAAGGEEAAVLGLAADGLPDLSFADAGIARLPTCGDAVWSGLADVAVDWMGRVVLAGSVYSATGEDQVGLLRLQPNGALDTTFGNSGSLRFDFAPDSAGSIDWVSSLALTPWGTIVVGGHADSDEAAGGTTAFSLARVRGY